MPIVIGALGTVTKRLVQGLEDLEIRGQGETIQTTVLSRSTRILRRVGGEGDTPRLCKKFEFDHTNKWYMHCPEFVLENQTHKLQGDLEIQTDHLISARRPDLDIESVV